MLYLIQISVYTGLMFLVYLLFLRNRPMHAFNRGYLLACTILPLLLPFIKLPSSFSNDMPGPILNFRLPEVTVGQDAQPAYTNAISIAVIVYAIISVLILSAVIWQWIKIRRVINGSEKERRERYTLLKNSGFGPGSWSTYIFLPGMDEHETIIKHELAHIQLHHTHDLVLMNLLQVCFWPNLFLFWIKKELVQVHEFQADAASGVEAKAYSELLLSNIFNSCTLPMSHSFIIHPIKRRIMMLGKRGSKSVRIMYSGFAVCATLFFVANILWLQSCKSKKWDVAERPYKTIVYSGKEGPADSIEIFAGDLFTMAEKMPRFPGDSLQSFIAHNLVYPQEARSKGLEGKVLVQFIVRQDGSIANAKVYNVMPHDIKISEMKNFPDKPDPLLEKAALDVVNKMPKWIPGEDKGKKVAVRFGLPINFRLQ